MSDPFNSLNALVHCYSIIIIASPRSPLHIIFPHVFHMLEGDKNKGENQNHVSSNTFASSLYCLCRHPSLPDQFLMLGLLVLGIGFGPIVHPSIHSSSLYSLFIPFPFFHLCLCLSIIYPITSVSCDVSCFTSSSSGLISSSPAASSTNFLSLTCSSLPPGIQTLSLNPPC